MGADNINLVNPTHYANEIAQAFEIYRPKIPVVYNTHGYETIEKIYEKAGCPDKCHLFVKDVGHYWTGTFEWEAINQMAKEEGWF